MPGILRDKRDRAENLKSVTVRGVTRDTPLKGGVSHVTATPDTLRSAMTDLAGRVRRLAPSIRDPERFHVDKSEIAHALDVLAREVR